MSSGNPAGRLLAIVEEARKLSDETSIQQAWERILGVDKNNHSQMMFRLGHVMLLPEQAMAEIREHYPDEEDAQKHWVGQVNKALFQGTHTGQKWNGVKQHLDNHTVQYLKMAAAMLKMVQGERLLGSDQLDTMRSKLNDILEELEAHNLSRSAKAIIRSHLNAILSALDEYKICGKQGIEEASHRAVGELAVNRELREEVSNTPVGKKFAAVLILIFGIVGGANDSLQLAGSVPKFLEDLRSSEEQVVEYAEENDEKSNVEK
jgi:hypothetical protein